MERTVSKTTRNSLLYGAAYLALWIAFRFYLPDDPWVVGLCRPWILIPLAGAFGCIPLVSTRARPATSTDQPTHWWDIASLNRAVAIWLMLMAFYLLPYRVLFLIFRSNHMTFHSAGWLIESPLVIAVLSLARPNRSLRGHVESPAARRANRVGLWIQIAMTSAVSVFLVVMIIACTEPARDGSSNSGFMVFFSLCLLATVFVCVHSIRSLRALRANGDDEPLQQSPSTLQ